MKNKDTTTDVGNKIVLEISPKGPGGGTIDETFIETLYKENIVDVKAKFDRFFKNRAYNLTKNDMIRAFKQLKILKENKKLTKEKNITISISNKSKMGLANLGVKMK
jgi:hypothetical protein